MKLFTFILFLLAGCSLPESGWAKCSDYTGQIVFEGHYTDLSRSARDVVSIQANNGNIYYLYNTCCVFTERPIRQEN